MSTFPSITWNGTYLGDENLYNLLVLKGPKPGMADIKLDLQSYSTTRGGTSQGASLGMLFFTRTCDVEGTSRPDVYAKMDAVKGIIIPTLGEVVIRFDEDINLSTALDREFLGRLNGPLRFEEKTPTRWRFNLNIVVPEGVARQLSQTVETPVVGSDPVTVNVPVSAASVVGGDIAIGPEWKIKNTSGAPVLSLILTNNTRSETIRWAGSIANNTWIRIDTAREAIETSPDDSTWTNAIGGITAGDPFPSLTGGARESITLTGFGTADFTVTFRGEFL